MTLAECVAKAQACANRAAGLQDAPITLSVITAATSTPVGAAKLQTRALTVIETGCRLEWVNRSINTGDGWVRVQRLRVEIPAHLTTEATINNPSLLAQYKGQKYQVTSRAPVQIFGEAVTAWALELERGSDG